MNGYRSVPTNETSDAGRDSNSELWDQCLRSKPPLLIQRTPFSQVDGIKCRQLMYKGIRGVVAVCHLEEGTS